MALTWYWDSKIGSVERKSFNSDRKYYSSLYRGNAFLIEIYDDEQCDTYSLQSFLVDKKHAKNMINDECKTYENSFDGTPTRVILLKDEIDKKEIKDYLYYLAMLGAQVELV